MRGFTTRTSIEAPGLKMAPAAERPRNRQPLHRIEAFPPPRPVTRKDVIRKAPFPAPAKPAVASAVKRPNLRRLQLFVLLFPAASLPCTQILSHPRAFAGTLHGYTLLLGRARSDGNEQTFAGVLLPDR